MKLRVFSLMMMLYQNIARVLSVRLLRASAEIGILKQ